MENVTFTKRELRIKSWLGLPSAIITFFVALAFNSKGWWAYLGIFIFGFYLYTLLYWKLYQRYMLNKLYKEKIKFYGLLVGYQLSLLGVIVAFALKS